MPNDVHGRALEAEAEAAVQQTLIEALLTERERESFRAESTRALSGLLNTERNVARTLDLLVPRLADWGQVSLRTSDGVEVTTSDGATARRSARSIAAGPDPTFDRVLRTGRPRRFVVDDHGELARLVPAAGLRAEVSASAPCGVAVLPLRAGGEVFGALTLLWSDSRRMDDAALAMAADLAQAASTALEAARLYAARAHTARVLEESLRPGDLPDIRGVRLASFYRSTSPEYEVGGDFYDVHGEAADWSLIIGDVSGSGIEAAVLTGQARQALQTAGLVDRCPGRMLSLANRSLLAAAGNRFVTMLCCRLRLLPEGSVRLDVASAGHPGPLVLRADGSVQEVPVSGTAAGLFADCEYPVVSVELGPGDGCLLYTDGVTEARGADPSFFGLESLQASLGACAGAGPQAIVDYVAQQVLEHLRGAPHDDLALLALGLDP